MPQILCLYCIIRLFLHIYTSYITHKTSSITILFLPRTRKGGKTSFTCCGLSKYCPCETTQADDTIPNCTFCVYYTMRFIINKVNITKVIYKYFLFYFFFLPNLPIKAKAAAKIASPPRKYSPIRITMS